MIYSLPTPGIFLQPEDVFIIQRFLEAVNVDRLSDEDRKYLHDLLIDIRKVGLSFTPGIL